jgi:acyl dehydratase
MIEDMWTPKIDWFPIEAGHIMLFARAVGDPNPIYADQQYAKSRGGIIAPPTFLEAGLHFDENFPFRPRLGKPWLGSRATPTGLPPEQLDAGTDMHAETHFEYHKVLRPGMVLHAKSRRGTTWETEGKRAGKLIFGDAFTDYYDQDEQLVATHRLVVVSTERKVAQPAGAAVEKKVAPELHLDLPTSYPAMLGDLAVGAKRKAVVAVNLTRAQIIQYAGAAGDFSPQHVDEVYNTQVAKYPSVFGHGMLTMGMTARLITDWIGDGKLTKYGFQFRQQLWPGDSVIAAGTVRAVNNGMVEIDIETTNQHGALLGKGYAVARVTP